MIFSFSEFIAVLPEFFIAISICFFLTFFSFFSTVGSSFFKKRFPVLRTHSIWFSFLIISCTFFLVINNPIDLHLVFYGSFILDSTSQVTKIFFLYVSLLCLVPFVYLLRQSNIHAFEYSVLFLFSLFSIILMASANDLITFYLAIELQSLSFYVLAAFKRGSGFSTEAGLKYFIIGAFSSGLFLWGCSIIYGSCGSTNYESISRLFSIDFGQYSSICIIGLCFLIVSILFKLSAAPFHAWAPDTYEGSPLSSTIIFSIFPKLPLVVALCRIMFECFYSFNLFWEILISLSAILSIIFGTFGAIHQSKIKRFLVYSSIGHAGYFLIALVCGNLFGLTSSFFYLFVYILTSILIWISFSTLTLNPFLPKKISLKFLDQFVILTRDNNPLAFLFTVAILSIAGIPPLLGFFAKWIVFFSLLESSFFFISSIIVIFSAISCFYYLRLIKIFYFDNFAVKGFCNSRVTFFSFISKDVALILSTNMFILLFFYTSPGLLYFFCYKISLSIFI